MTDLVTVQSADEVANVFTPEQFAAWLIGVHDFGQALGIDDSVVLDFIEAKAKALGAVLREAA